MIPADFLLAALFFAVAVLYSSVGHAGASGYIAAMALLGFAPEQVRPTALALILLVGGVIGAQFGAHTGQRMRAERLRLLLGLLVFMVGMRFAYELVVQPNELYSIRMVGFD